jgi:hypothetical protein
MAQRVHEIRAVEAGCQDKECSRGDRRHNRHGRDGADEGSARSAKSTSTRRKMRGRGTAERHETENERGNRSPQARRRAGSGRTLAPDGRIRDIDLRRVLIAMRDLREGDFDVRLPTSEDR